MATTKEAVKSQISHILREGKAAQNKIADQAIVAVMSLIDKAWHEEEVVPTMHNILVSFSGTPPKIPIQEYAGALQIYCQRQNSWLATQGLRARRRTVEAATVEGKPGDYHFASLVRELQKQGAITFNGQNAYYLWMASPGIAIGGTLGGDVFGQKGGRHSNREPGVSAFDVDGVHCLATGRPLNPTRTMPLDWVMGAAGHEEGHQYLLPCADAPHGPGCIMERWWMWPTNVYERDGWIWSDGGKNHRQAGDEVAYLLGTGFYQEV